MDIKDYKTVNSIKQLTVHPAIEDEKIEDTLDGKAQLLADMLEDQNSIDFFRILVRTTNPERLLDYAHQTRTRSNEKRLHIPKAKYFMSILKRVGINVHFRKDKDGGK
ncbi:hypothetical protein KKB64_05160 [Patescibacteria group bacterium]|nr:hypothetical protein [Patescibacteria group bacterium]MBU1473141.1 hypothetical protein [Patescibacteria group bacterium]MBU2459532.1 hypothetical protein [Patescibacteria group bacterium]